MNTTLAVVVSAIVILITALVVITIFSEGITQVATLGQARTLCETNFRTICLSTGQSPNTWDIKNMNTNGEIKSCRNVVTCTCSSAQPYTAVCT